MAPAPVFHDPLVIDVDKDGLELLPLSAKSFFDLNAAGGADRIGWVTGGDGLLVYDRNSNGTIDNGSELYGSN